MKGRDLYSVNGGYEADSVRDILYQNDLDLDKLEGRQGEKFRFWSISLDEKGNPTFDPLFGNLELDKSFKRERTFHEGDLLFSYKPSDGEQLIEGTIKHKPAIIFTGEENGCPTKPIVTHLSETKNSGDLENSPERVTSAIVLDMIKRNPKPFIQKPDMAVKMVNGLLNDKTVKTLSEMSTADFLKSFRSTSSREKILKQVETTMKEQKLATEKTHEEAKKEKALDSEPKKEDQGLVRR